MTQPKSKLSLAEQITALNNPAPSYDPEDASDTDTEAKVAEFEYETAEDNEKSRPSALRRRAAVLLSEEDKRYAGRSASRKDIWKDDDITDSIDDDAASCDDAISSSDEQMDMNSDEVTSEKEFINRVGKNQTTEIEDVFKKIKEEMDRGSSATDSDINDDSDNDDDTEDEDDSDISDADDMQDASFHGNQEAGSEVQTFSDVNVAEEIAKGKATKTQLALWDTFMEQRIRLQKALAIANQLPSFDKQETFIEQGGKAVQDSLHSSSAQLKKLLRQLIQLQQVLLLGNPATRHIVEGREKTEKDSDEEIASSDNDDNDDATIPTESLRKPTTKKHRKRKADVGNIGEFLAKRHKDFQSFQYDTIQKWHDKTKLSSGKQGSKSFSSFEKSAVSQIQQLLQDKPRLIRRTQLRRGVLGRLGDTEKEEDASMSKPESEEQVLPGSSHLKDYDEETFDDDDFYHQLLRELIDKKTSSTTDPVQLTRQWLEVQKLRRKIKKKVDTKASKGRKMRYDVHAKLVSFMAARDTGTMIEDAKNELFCSLFGMRKLMGDVQGRKLVAERALPFAILEFKEGTSIG